LNTRAAVLARLAEALVNINFAVSTGKADVGAAACIEAKRNN
jgi:hypothetical protein